MIADHIMRHAKTAAPLAAAVLSPSYFAHSFFITVHPRSSSVIMESLLMLSRHNCLQSVPYHSSHTYYILSLKQ